MNITERRTSVGVSEEGKEGPKIRNTEEDIRKGVLTHGDRQRQTLPEVEDRQRGGPNHLLVTSRSLGHLSVVSGLGFGHSRALNAWLRSSDFVS